MVVEQLGPNVERTAGLRREDLQAHEESRLAQAGVAISAHAPDFGTGYSSFAYLRDLPVHEVKLDISFITRLGRNERDARVVAGMIRMAHELGLRVVAEGVEHPAQLD